MKTKIFLFALGVIIALSGCTGNQQQRETKGETVTVTHTLGTVEVPVNPQRVVALDFSALENLDYLGVKPVAIPKSGVPRHLSKYKDDPSIVDVGTVVEVNLEKINELQPDLIIIGGRLADFYNDLSAIAPVIYPTVMGTTDFLGAFKSNLDDLGRIFDKQDEIDRAYAEIEMKVGITEVGSALMAAAHVSVSSMMYWVFRKQKKGWEPMFTETPYRANLSRRPIPILSLSLIGVWWLAMPSWTKKRWKISL